MTCPEGHEDTGCLGRVCVLRREQGCLWGLAEPITPYPTGRVSWDTFSRHFVPGYDPSVPTGR
ncbi:MAG TPA: hypothetical protein VE860_09670, partial [Chthoniobacterales bacterium]|nr:hypothetical protein [Chthoniobacterales bacterium]